MKPLALAFLVLSACGRPADQPARTAADIMESCTLVQSVQNPPGYLETYSCADSCVYELQTNIAYSQVPGEPPPPAIVSEVCKWGGGK